MTLSRNLIRSLVVAAGACAVPAMVFAAKPAKPVAPVAAPAKPVAVVTPKVDSASIEFFERKIRPVLVQNCYQCHAATSEKLKAGLYCDSREGLVKGGDSGPAIIPGNPAKSPLVRAVKGTDKEISQMPPKTKLSDQQIADLSKWVEMGAPWPADKKAGAITAKAPTWNQEDRYAQLRKDHWAWKPVKQVSPPTVKNAAWPTSDIDKFVLAKIEENKLTPIRDADRVTLIRRLSFDLVGLPPKPEEVVAFVNDKSADAYEKLVDRLLASPQFGETWGRHWLDIARFSESTGSSRNYAYRSAWRYRDYVIDSFNDDKPYNTFIMEQIAGDLMPAKDAAQKNERVIATGFLAMGVKDLNERDHDKYVMDNVDEQIDTMGRSILATTIACARCHDHKFDPIPQEDYYKVAGIFKSTEIMAGVQSKKGAGKAYSNENLLIKLANVATTRAKDAIASVQPAQTPASKEARIQSLTNKIEALQADMRKMRAELGPSADKENAKKLLKENPAKGQTFVAKRQEVQALRAELAELESGKAGSVEKKAEAPKEMLAIGVKEGKPADCRINIRGDHDNLGAAVPRGFVSLIKVPNTPAVKPTESGRIELAQWLSSPANPLTARVMVNRIWHHLFGEGLVQTVDNFGSTGESPSHPELLDYLATQFVKDGWSVKKSIRTMVLSRTYRLSSGYNEANYESDPGNIFLWRHSLKRLEAEQIRDALLFAGGNLDLNRPEGSPIASLGEGELREGRKGGAFDRTGGNNRSVYIPVVRALVAPMMDAFDFAEPTMVTGDRDVTTVATQALFMMNNPFAIAQAGKLADRVLNDSSIGNDSERVDHAYGWALGRSATQAEKTRALQYIEGFTKEAGGPTSKSRQEAWSTFCQALIASAEFRYLN